MTCCWRTACANSCRIPLHHMKGWTSYHMHHIIYIISEFFVNRCISSVLQPRYPAYTPASEKHYVFIDLLLRLSSSCTIKEDWKHHARLWSVCLQHPDHSSWESHCNFYRASQSAGKRIRPRSCSTHSRFAYVSDPKSSNDHKLCFVNKPLSIIYLVIR